MKPFKKNYLLLLACIVYVALVFPTLSKPFIGHHDWIGVWNSNIARNLARYSPIDTKFGSVINVGPTKPEYFAYFTHYPPLLPVFLAGVFWLLGQSEASARTLGVIFTIFSTVMVYKIGRKYFDPNIGLLSALIFLAFPITIYFGRMPEHEILVLGPILLSLYLYLNFFENGTKSNFFKLIAILVFTHLIHWPGYYITPLLFMHYLIFGKGHNLKIAITFPLLSFLMFGIHMIHTALLTKNFLGGGLVDVLLYRLNVTSKPFDFTLFNFANHEIHMLFIYFTKTTLVLSIIAIFTLLLKFKKNVKSPATQILIILGIFGLTHILVFQNMAYIHDYMVIYLAPFLALTASLGFFKVAGKFSLSKPAISILAILLILMVFFERKNYVDTLLKSNSFYPGYMVGTLIKNNTNINDKSLILSDEFAEYFDVFVGYYSDREVFYGSEDSLQIRQDIEQNRYASYIAIPSRDTKKEAILQLQKHFKEAIVDGYYIYTPK